MFGLFSKNTVNINDDSVTKLKKGLLIDVREISEFKEGHLPNAINVPSSGIILNANKFLKNKNETYYIYCLSGGRASNVKKQLEKQGYKIENLGGIMSYKGKVVK